MNRNINMRVMLYEFMNIYEAGGWNMYGKRLSCLLKSFLLCKVFMWHCKSFQTQRAWLTEL